MPKVTQFIISEESKPGTLAHVASVLGDSGVNIKAFSAPEVTGHGNLRVIVSDVEGARAALQGGKIKFTEEEALALSLANTPGALGQVAKLLKEAKVNIACGYCTPSREGRRAIVVLTVSDTDKALAILRGHALDEF